MKAAESRRKRPSRNGSKEPVYDTERWTGGVAPPANIQLFTSFNAFANALGAGPLAGTLTKQFARDTNLSGQQGLPAAHHVGFQVALAA